MSRILHLHDDETSIVVDARGPGLPVVAHWGAPLGEPGEDELAALLDALAPSVSPNTPDRPVPLTVLPAFVHGVVAPDRSEALLPILDPEQALVLRVEAL